uniref:Beta-1,4-N-acetylgalactosaminyltransferase n=1 Tax=Timema poppense TaxID=170557 RepID=A0A7R9DFP2_TIMPO|nr:unnamed protein product [Timema poppensis]
MAPYLYKVLLLLVLAVIALQYGFTLVFERRHLEPLFSINSTQTHSRHRASAHPRTRGLLFSLATTPVGAGVGVEVTTRAPPHNTSSQTPSTINSLSNVVTEVTGMSNATSTVATVGRALCPPIPPDLEGHIEVSVEPLSLSELAERFPQLEPGGRWRPTQCQSRDKVALVVPYRDRAQHLAIFLRNLHPMLQRQQIDYGIYVIEQAGTGPFNRAMLMNVGFVEALKQYNYDCFIFHDVDLLPEDDRNLYTCPEQPRHMSVAVDVLKYKLPYTDIFGGVSALTQSQFRKVNGFSNMFWGWGGEDDDMSNRIKFHGYHISRYPANVARYKMLTHRKQRANPKRYEYLNTGRKRFSTDGLNSLRYRVKDLQLHKLFTRFVVELEKPS